MRNLYLLAIAVLLGYGLFLMAEDLFNTHNAFFPLPLVVGLGWALTALLNLLSWWYGSRAPHARFAAVFANLVFALACFLNVGLSSVPLGVAAVCFVVVACLPERSRLRRATAS